LPEPFPISPGDLSEGASVLDWNDVFGERFAPTLGEHLRVKRSGFRAKGYQKVSPAIFHKPGA
jgi:hypothetical protein